MALFPHRVPPPVPLGHGLLRGRTSSACSSSCESNSRSEWRSSERSERRFKACGGRLGPCDLGADNGRDKRGVSNPRTGAGTATRQKQGGCSRPRSTADGDQSRQARGTERRACEGEAHRQPAGVQSLAASVDATACSCCLDVTRRFRQLHSKATTTAFCRGSPRGVSSPELGLDRNRAESPHAPALEGTSGGRIQPCSESRFALSRAPGASSAG